MAVVGEIRVRTASRADWDALEEAVGVAMGVTSEPPTGFMVGLTRPVGDGFGIISVWRSESEMREFFAALIMPVIIQVGLEAEDIEVVPLWGLAKP